ncbi:MAG TPA: carboxypeptidase M32 [Candidatus Hydrogenedentes bacterium]|nr:carboxypeptidase M32 [Candidatus Hydrogenedentota bacterium]
MENTGAFSRLRDRLRDVHNLRMAAAVLNWDMEVCMPPKGAAARGGQLATLAALAHERFTHPETGTLIRQAQDNQDTLADDERAALREVDYDYRRAARIPENFVRRFAQTRSAAYHAWLDARKQSDFAVFQTHLQKLVTLARELADYLGYEDTPYNALLEDFERGMTTAQLRAVFDELAPRQRALIERIMNAPTQPDAAWLEQTWDADAQWAFTERVLRDMGYDFDAGRQDKSAHPFTTNFSIGDVRITTRLNERDLFSALFSSIHECGHALYEQGFPPEDEGTILAEAPSLGIHESQSRLWENIIGRSLPFWRHYMPVLREHFPGQLDNVDAEQVYAAANRVAPSLIRVEADECTYNLHIILRFELETALIEGNLAAADLPAAWNEKMAAWLGVAVPDDANGCLQDIHWSHGTFGYFPTYALGNLYAAQMFDAVTKAIPGIMSSVGRGEFTPLLAWLRENVHRVGRRKTTPEIVRDATGEEPAAAAFLKYLENKYAPLYGLAQVG